MVYDRTYITSEFEWDRRKASTNLKKHGIDFADATEVFFDTLAISVPDTEPGRDEDRFVTIGVDGLGRILVVVFTWREDRIRIISARNATPNERKQYGRTP